LRNGIGNLVTLVFFFFVAGGLLQIFTGNTRLAFVFIFAGALVGRLISLYFLSLTPDHGRLYPKYTPGKYPPNSPGAFFLRISDDLSFLLFF